MNKLVKINVNTSICPNCGGGLKKRTEDFGYRCFHCGAKYKIIGMGNTEREMICETGDMETCK